MQGAQVQHMVRKQRSRMPLTSHMPHSTAENFNNNKIDFKKYNGGIVLPWQFLWLRLHGRNAGGTGLTPGRGRSHKPHGVAKK